MSEWKKRVPLTSVGRREGIEPIEWEDLILPDMSGSTFFTSFMPARPGIALAEVFRRHAASITTWLDRRGALLFRGFGIDGPHELDWLSHSIGTGPFETCEETSPRTHILGSVYTATEYPAQYAITFHNESSYQATMPSKLLFYCARSSCAGGATRLSDCREVWRALPDKLRSSLAREGYRITRTYHPNFGLSWRQAFGVDDRAAVEAITQRDGIHIEWKDGDVLTTTQVRPCVSTHPRTGDICWTNHLHFFHHSNLPEDATDALSGDQDAGDFINDSRHANGEAIHPNVLRRIQRAYEANAVSVDWQPGDILLVDNVAIAHGRCPYVGTRDLYVTQTDPIGWDHLRYVPHVHGE